MLGPVLPARQNDNRTSRGVCFPFFHRARCEKVARVDLRGGQGAARSAAGGSGPRLAAFDAVNLGGVVAHRADRRDGFMKRLAKALRLLDLDRKSTRLNSSH